MEYHEWRDGQPRPPLKDSTDSTDLPDSSDSSDSSDSEKSESMHMASSKGLGASGFADGYANGERPRTGAVFFLSSGGIMFCAHNGTDEGGPASMANTLCRGIEPGHRLICGLPVGEDNGIPDW